MSQAGWVRVVEGAEQHQVIHDGRHHGQRARAAAEATLRDRRDNEWACMVECLTHW